jgi:hypothetical protein
MPPVEEVFKQFLLLGSKLRTAARDVATAASPGRRWKGASGTVIMKDLWADPELKKLTAGCEAYLYLWVHCATKTHNEAVVEAMGSKWDAAARDVRHLHLKRRRRRRSLLGVPPIRGTRRPPPSAPTP